MEFLKSKRLPAWFYSLALLLLCGAAYHGANIWRQMRLERELANPDAIIVAENTPAILIFAKARRLDEAGNSPEAVRLYASLLKNENLDLRARAYHNLGTIYLRDAARRWNARGVLEFARVNTEVELAKENYRQALRLNPQDWDARYNLEYAYRITPPPKEKPKADFQGSKSSVFSTLPGLPGGGP